jgi:hypothetical protein
VSEATILRWGRRGVLPKYEVHHGGARGHVARWPPHAPQQAVWVHEQLEARRSWEDILAQPDWTKSLGTPFAAGPVTLRVRRREPLRAHSADGVPYTPAP